MHITSQQSLFSHAYIMALASTAGYNVGVDYIDDDSIDCTLKSRSVGKGRLELQLKATTNFPQIGSTETLPFALSVKNYDDLRLTPDEFLVPRMLVVLLLPREIARWIEHGPDETILRHSAFHLNLRGMPPTDNEVSKTVHLDWNSQLTTETLSNLMEHVSEHGDLP